MKKLMPVRLPPGRARLATIPWTLIGWVFVLGGVRLLSERFAAYRTARQAKSMHIVNQPLQLHAAS
jgi:hypothetical protein